MECNTLLSVIALTAFIISSEASHSIAVGCSKGLLLFEGRCFAECPRNTLRLLDENTCVTKCPKKAKYIQQGTCVSFCKSILTDLSGTYPKLFCVEKSGLVNRDIPCPKNLCKLPRPFCYRFECYDTCQDYTYAEGNQCVDKCSDQRPLIYNRTCVTKCPEENAYVENGRCVRSCSEYLMLYGLDCVNKCSDQRPLIYNRTCVTACPEEKAYAEYGRCVSSCSASLVLYGHNCVRECPRSHFLYEDLCLTECPSNASYVLMVNGISTCVSSCPDLLIVKNKACYPCHLGQFTYNGTCLQQCPEKHRFVDIQDILSSKVFSCKHSCPSDRFADNFNCIQKCHKHMFVYNQTCLERCPLEAPIENLANGYPASCTTMCPNGTFALNKTCLSRCPSYMLADKGKFCVKRCPKERPLIAHESLENCFSECPLNMVQLNNTCITGHCPHSTYLFNRTCMQNCPPGLNYKTANTMCMGSCPTDTPFNDSFVCRARCPSRVPYSRNNTCVYTCPLFSQYIFNETCLNICPSTYPYTLNNRCLEACPHNSYKLNQTCHYQCPLSHMFVVNDTCNQKCPQIYPYVRRKNNKRECVHACLKYSVNLTCYDACPSPYFLLGNNCVQHCSGKYKYKFFRRFPLLETCVENCTTFSNSIGEDQKYTEDNKCVHKCTSGLNANGVCVTKCPNELPFEQNTFLQDDRSCVKACENYEVANATNNVCISKSDCTNNGMFIIMNLGQCVNKCPNNSIYVIDTETDLYGRSYKPYCISIGIYDTIFLCSLVILAMCLLFCWCLQFNNECVWKLCRKRQTTNYHVNDEAKNESSEIQLLLDKEEDEDADIPDTGQTRHLNTVESDDKQNISDNLISDSHLRTNAEMIPMTSTEDAVVIISEALVHSNNDTKVKMRQADVECYSCRVKEENKPDSETQAFNGEYDVNEETFEKFLL